MSGGLCLAVLKPPNPRSSEDPTEIKFFRDEEAVSDHHCDLYQGAGSGRQG
jgi:hypothetical protein